MTTEPDTRVGHNLLGAEYEAGTPKRAASLDLVWFDPDAEKNIYLVLSGRRAKKLQHLKPGDIYYEETGSGS
jgi:hypothetical protein